jgi:hypothetical protein
MPHPLKNRVDPWGNLLRDERSTATRMGNRGVLHDKEQEVVRYSKTKAWLCCRMDLPGFKRSVFQTDPVLSYSELFFLDEATALSAGHRPCNDCQPYRFKQFKRAWCAAHCPEKSPSQLLISEVDEIISAERIGPDDKKPTFAAPLDTLPVGTFFTLNGNAFLVTSGGVFEWSLDGYSRASLPKLVEVDVLTPKSAVAVLRKGYVPWIHTTADAT